MATELRKSDIRAVYGKDGPITFAGLDDSPDHPSVIAEIEDSQKQVDVAVAEFQVRLPFSAVRSARYLAESSIMPAHFNKANATATIRRGLEYALTVKPTEKALEVEQEFNNQYPQVIYLSELIQTPPRRFMTFNDVHQAAKTSMLVAAG